MTTDGLWFCKMDVLEVNMSPMLARSSRSLVGGDASSGFAGLVEWIFDRMEKRRQRRQLAGLDDHLLKDIGISRADVWRELHR